jgi:hypothetical protein
MALIIWITGMTAVPPATMAMCLQFNGFRVALFGPQVSTTLPACMRPECLARGVLTTFVLPKLPLMATVVRASNRLSVDGGAQREHERLVGKLSRAPATQPSLLPWLGWKPILVQRVVDTSFTLQCLQFRRTALPDSKRGGGWKRAGSSELEVGWACC